MFFSIAYYFFLLQDKKKNVPGLWCNIVNMNGYHAESNRVINSIILQKNKYYQPPPPKKTSIEKKTQKNMDMMAHRKKYNKLTSSLLTHKLWRVKMEKVFFK